MVNYYLDIETTGLNPATSEIITIQYQRLDSQTGEAVGELHILKAWDSSEKEIICRFNKLLTINVWDFVPHGYNLKFEHDFLFERSKENGFKYPIDLLKRPHVDLHPIGIMMNGGNFKGSGLDKISGKKGNGFDCLEAYYHNDYGRVEEYIIQETREYIKLYVWLKRRMPELLTQYQSKVLNVGERSTPGEKNG